MLQPVRFTHAFTSQVLGAAGHQGVFLGAREPMSLLLHRATVEDAVGDQAEEIHKWIASRWESGIGVCWLFMFFFR